MKPMFILKHGNKYVAIDHSSGGYPYLVDRFDMAFIWIDINSLRAYQKMFPKYVAYQIEVKEKPIKDTK
jgi:hypothetical protein